jgi:hypothetical protein
MIHKVKLSDGSIKYAVIGMFGSPLSRMYKEKEDLTINDLEDGEEIFRLFDTNPEAVAFISGINSMDGWNGFSIGEDWEYHEKQLGLHGLELFKEDKVEQVNSCY